MSGETREGKNGPFKGRVDCRKGRTLIWTGIEGGIVSLQIELHHFILRQDVIAAS
jgi:hypothetical protein